MPDQLSYIDTLPDWRKTLKNASLLFDANAIINISSYSSQKVIDEFSRHNVACCYTHPVFVEVLNTNNSSERVARQSILDKLSFVKINDRVNEKAEKLLIELHSVECYPSPTDLYLGACSKWYPDMFILTANIKDFPYPAFERYGGIVLQNNKSVILISILKCTLWP